MYLRMLCFMELGTDSDLRGDSLPRSDESHAGIMTGSGACLGTLALVHPTVDNSGYGATVVDVS